MIRVLIRKELLANLRTARLAIAAALTLILTVLAVGIGSMEFSRNFTHFESRQRDLAERRDKVTTWTQAQRATSRVIIPPQPLGILARGLPGTAVQGTGFGVGRRIQSQQERSASRDENRTYVAAVNLERGTVMPLTDESTRTAEITRDGRWAIGRDETEYVSDWRPDLADFYRLDTRTGERVP